MSALDTHATDFAPHHAHADHAAHASPTAAATAPAAGVWPDSTLWRWQTAAPAERVLGVVLCAMLTAACAQISVPMPGSPVPVTLQTFAVILSGLVLGPALGASSMVLYVLAGLVGLPVFAGADGGLRVALGATGGYLLGFVAASAVAGLIVRRARERGRAALHAAILAAVVGNVIVFACGLPWLKVVVASDWATTLSMGLWPYLVGTLVKVPMSVAAAVGLGVVSRVR
ncbi:MAG: biotin transporter BioY [Phycisphaerales bacterium]